MYPNYGFNPWGAAQTPVVFIPPTQPPSSTNPPQQFTSWQDVHRHAKRMAKQEEKLKRKWEEEAKKKKEGDKKPEIKRAMIPVAEALVLGVLVSPFLGYPTLLLMQKMLKLWSSAL